MGRSYAVLNIDEQEVSRRTGLTFVEDKEPNPSGPRLTAKFNIAGDPSPYTLAIYRGAPAPYTDAVMIESEFDHHSEQFAANAQPMLDALKLKNEEVDWTCRMGHLVPRMM